MKKDKTRRRESDRAIYRAITYTILPIVLSTLVYNISTIIDQACSTTFWQAWDLPKTVCNRLGHLQR